MSAPNRHKTYCVGGLTWVAEEAKKAGKKNGLSLTLEDQMDESQWKEEQFLQREKSRFNERKARADRTKLHPIIPSHFFSVVSSECRELFIDGHFYGCISLAQAYAERLSSFLRGFHSVGAKNDTEKRVKGLHAAKAITDSCRDAFLRIWGNDRNTLHHINKDIPTDRFALAERAEECVNALYTIESEVFAFEILENGAIAPKNRDYWPKSDPEHLKVFLRVEDY
jgi:hypothetical protein